MFVIAGCGSGESSSSDDSYENIELSLKDISQFDEEIQGMLENANQKTEQTTTSFDKIDSALEAGDISEEDRVLLTLLAAFDPEKLPSGYKGNDPEVMNDGLMMELNQWIDDNWEDLDTETQDAILPFILEPDHPDSFFNYDNKEKQSDMLKTLELIPSVDAAGGHWTMMESYIGGSTKVRIIFHTSKPEYEQRAYWINESMHKAWPMFETVFDKAPTETVYLYITDPGAFLGRAWMRNIDDKMRCKLLVSDKQDKELTQVIASHELFHCFQYYVPLKYDLEGRKWMMEATATWSEHWVWPDYNTEWAHLGKFFDSLDLDMIAWNKVREYSTYTWYKFLTQMSGGPAVVKQHLDAVENTDAREVVQSTDYYEMLWGEYALWNWNQDPEQRYSDTPAFPTGTYKGKKMYPIGDAYKGKIYDAKKEYPESLTLGSLSMQYRLMTFDDSIDKVVVKFEQEGDDLHKRQALIKIGDGWHREDWTEIEERKFCRTRDDEKVTAIVLILSDAVTDLTENYKVKYKVDTRGKCNPEWRGTTTWQFNLIDEWQILYAQTIYTQSASMISYDTLVMDEDENEFVIKDQFVTYNYREEQSTTFAQDCGMQYESMIKRQSGSAGKSFEIDEKYPSESDAPERMNGDYDDPFLYDVDIDVHDFGYDWLAYYDTRASSKKACELEGLFTPSSGSYTISETDMSKSDRFKTEPNDIKAKINLAGDRIYGQETQMWSHGDTEYPITITVDYRYQ